jgi:tetratricopeptide (TPR) repeat protein
MSGSLRTDYAKFQQVADDEEREERALKDAEAASRKELADQRRAEYEASRAARMNQGGSSSGSSGNGSGSSSSGGPAIRVPTKKPPAASGGFDPKTLESMTDEERGKLLEQYSSMFNRNRPKQKYHFPDTIEEQRVICEAAAELRQRGNALYKKGELMEAAKLYEQAVLKFGDWYSECFATEEERSIVHAVKLPSHLNLAACSWKLGNFEHAVVHCKQVRLFYAAPAHAQCSWRVRP